MQHTIKQSTSLRTRILAVFIGFGLCFTLLGGRLGYWMLYRGEEMRQEGKNQWERTATVAPKRGMILDATGKVLAQSASALDVVLTPARVTKDKQRELAALVAPYLGLDEQAVYERAMDTSKADHTLARQLEPEQARPLLDALKQSGLKGVELTETSRRYYPQGDFLTQVLGFCNISGKGQDGLELTLNAVLAGLNGSIKSEKDAKGRRLPGTGDTFVEPQDGQNVVLTVDAVVQGVAERAMRQAMADTGAKRMQCIVMDVRTSAILAMVNIPDFDLNSPPRDDLSLLSSLMRNGCVTDNYEPGSTFKMITTAAALEEKLSNPDEVFNCHGSIIVDGDKIRCWRTGDPHGRETLTQAVMNSCNPVFVELGLRLGKEKLYNYIDGFGFGKTTGSELSGEAIGIVMSPKYVKNVDLARIAFGQSVAVTPLQMINAACAIVNGGYLMKPTIVSQVTDVDGNIVKTYEPQVLAHPISEETSATMRAILEQVVEQGGGRNAYIPGYRVGGKTGTAQKYENGKIRTDVHVCSFVGFAPMDDPRVAVLVINDEPSLRPDFGSTTAAPYAKQVLEETLKYLDVRPAYKAGEKDLTGKTATVPDVQGMVLAEATQTLQSAGLQVITDGAGAKVVEQLPPPGASVPLGSLVMAYLQKTDEPTADLVEVPDVAGKSLIEANRTLRAAGLQMKLSGTGVAVSQTPAAGALQAPGATVEVKFAQP